MNLYFLKHNNYYNRRYKPITSLTGATVLGYIYNVSNFDPADGVDTTQETAYETFTDIPDYMLAMEGEEIVSRWYVVEAKRIRGGKYRLDLHRDVIADYFADIENAPMFIEKGYVPYSNPLIFNKEQMSFNKVKKHEILLKDEYPCAWLVAYVATNDNGESPTNIEGSVVASDAAYDIEVPNQGDITAWEYYKYTTDAIGPGNELYSNTYNHLFHVYTIGDQSTGSYLKYSFDESNSTGVSRTAAQGTTCINISVSNLVNNYNLYSGSINSKVNGQIGTASTAYINNINALDGKIIKYYSGGYKYSRIYVKTKTEHYNETYVSAGALYNNMKAWVEGAGGTNINNKTLSFETDVTRYYIELFDITQNISAKFTFDTTKQKLADAPYYMVCMPYGDFTLHITEEGTVYNLPQTKEFAMDLMNSFVFNGQQWIYDYQLLPYCPINGLSASVDDLSSDIYVENYTQPSIMKVMDGVGLKSVVFLAKYSKFSTQINMANKPAYNYLTKVETDAVERKVKNECDLVRIASPNGSNSFDFSPQMNDGFDYIQVDCTYKPYSPYIHIAPDFAGLYGDNFGDTRGLIVQGDFSLPTLTSQWKQYEINNKNYANVFDRETQSLEFKEKYRRIEQGISVGASALTAGVSSGAMVGGGLGAAVGLVTGAASLGAGIADISISKQLYEEQMDYRKDMYNMNLENIQARPTGLAKTSAFTNNNKIYPFIEYYTATDVEKEALRNKIKYNGMTIGVIGKIMDYVGSTETYVKGSLITSDISDDYHTVQAINNELNMGIRIGG